MRARALRVTAVFGDDDSIPEAEIRSGLGWMPTATLVKGMRSFDRMEHCGDVLMESR